MAMNKTQQNIAEAIRKKAYELLQWNNSINAIATMWTTEGMGDLVDADWSALPEFPGVSQAEALAAKNALSSISTSIGTYDVGTNARALIKLCSSIPNGK